MKGDSKLKAKFFVATSGSSGTLAAGDYLKGVLGSAIAVVEAIQCPTLLNNGYGEHNIQGIGDKHVPLIHNVMNTDFVVGISDQATNNLNLLFNTEIGQNYLLNNCVNNFSTIKILTDLFSDLFCNNYLGLNCGSSNMRS